MPAASILLEAVPQPGGGACFRTTRACSSPTGRGCGLPAAARPNSPTNASALPGRNRCSGCSLRSDRTSGREQRAFAGRSCGPLGPDGPIPARDEPAAGRRSLRRRGAALRPGAAEAASLRDRVCQQTVPPRQIANKFAFALGFIVSLHPASGKGKSDLPQTR